MADVLKEEIIALQQVVTLRENLELLMDTVVNLLTKVIQYCHQKGIPVESEMSINIMLHETRILLQKLQGIPNITEK